DFDWEGVKNIKATIDSNPTGFSATVVVLVVISNACFACLKLTLGLCCRPAISLQCCVFPAAVVLLDSWHVLLRNLWDEHLNHSLIIDLKQTLDKIIQKNKNTEETDLAQLSRQPSSPEHLLNLTSQLLARWLEVGCSPSINTCVLPTLPPSVERKDYGPSRARLLTTRAVCSEEKGQPEKMIEIDVTQPPSNSGPQSLSYYTPVFSPLLFRLYWWLLP
uniref:Uncharacterized protein n=1 Tax=Mola mola TaxID=94237 RepID=A0A3Q3X1E4_MOLML